MTIHAMLPPVSRGFCSNIAASTSKYFPTSKSACKLRNAYQCHNLRLCDVKWP